MKLNLRKIGLTAVLAGSACLASPALAAPGAPAPAVLPAPPAGQGQIVFWRPGTIVGAALGCGVNLKTERVSALGRGRYFLLNLAPGAYEFNAKSEAKDTLNLEVEPGEVYFVKCTIRMGIMVGRPNLSPSSLAEFAAKKADLKYVDSDDLGTRVLADPGVAMPAASSPQPAAASATPAAPAPEPAPAPVATDSSAPAAQ